ncbi:hypothetical protein [Phenylobacterium montanum]|uniref:Uncharacterized protein n=1 Tax=Phenylobacterium montanum TaxID=2823693 RepID=A0A975G519_9CAUL|nr:hypothetical protein [Caulobacter sp. S6]QUD90176.1 hypothetical protein KCG34_10060 [Caulobacter sp. S6]
MPVYQLRLLVIEPPCIQLEDATFPDDDAAIDYVGRLDPRGGAEIWREGQLVARFSGVFSAPFGLP